MKIELKNIKVNLTFSEETTMFQADVFVNGKKTAYANNDGRGGCTFYNAYEGMRELLKEAEEYCLALPKVETEMFGNKMSWDMNLEYFIDDYIDAHVNAKEQAKFDKKLKKAMDSNILVGVPDGNGSYKGYTSYGFKTKETLAQRMERANGKLAVENYYKQIKKQLKKGEVIINTNLPF